MLHGYIQCDMKTVEKVRNIERLVKRKTKNCSLPETFPLKQVECFDHI